MTRATAFIPIRPLSNAFKKGTQRRMPRRLMMMKMNRIRYADQAESEVVVVSTLNFSKLTFPSNDTGFSSIDFFARRKGKKIFSATLIIFC